MVRVTLSHITNELKLIARPFDQAARVRVFARIPMNCCDVVIPDEHRVISYVINWNSSFSLALHDSARAKRDITSNSHKLSCPSRPPIVTEEDKFISAIINIDAIVM